MSAASLHVAIQMDPVAGIHILKDSTFVLGLEAQRRGHTLCYYEPWQLSLQDGAITATLRPLTLFDVREAHRQGATDAPFFALGAAEEQDLSTLDVVLMRQDPPFDMAYITACFLLERLAERGVLVVNDPAGVRGNAEKLLPLRWPEFCPPTLISRDKQAIAAFFAAHGDIILKPLYMHGGADVVRVSPRESLDYAMDAMLYRHHEPLVVQRFIPAVTEGDKRVILIDGEPVGAMRRVPQGGSVRANLMAGGKAEPATLTDRDRAICAAIGPELKRQGLLLAGIDIIGEYLTEINVTSPTCLQEIDRFDGVLLEAAVWDAIERRYTAKT